MHRIALAFSLVALGCGASSDPASPARTLPTGGTVSVRAEAETGGHALLIENATATTFSVHREIEVERQNGSAWEHVDASWLLVRTSCDENEPPACVDVAAGTTFRTAPWNDMFGDAQCACEECGPAGAGTYRFAITPCDGSTRLETATFDLD